MYDAAARCSLTWRPPPPPPPWSSPPPPARRKSSAGIVCLIRLRFIAAHVVLQCARLNLTCASVAGAPAGSRRRRRAAAATATPASAAPAAAAPAAAATEAAPRWSTRGKENPHSVLYYIVAGQRLNKILIGNWKSWLIEHYCIKEIDVPACWGRSYMPP